MPVRHTAIDRATFLLQTGGLTALAFVDGTGMAGIARLASVPCAHDSHRSSRRDEPLEHPEPREGITAVRVLTVDALGTAVRPKAAAAYESARTYPAVFDGIACSCSCGGKKKTHRSLLVCYETAQATGCGECQLEGELVGRLAKEGKTLDEIRKAVDKEFG